LSTKRWWILTRQTEAKNSARKPRVASDRSASNAATQRRLISDCRWIVGFRRDRFGVGFVSGWWKTQFGPCVLPGFSQHAKISGQCVATGARSAITLF